MTRQSLLGKSWEARSATGVAVVGLLLGVLSCGQASPGVPPTNAPAVTVGATTAPTSQVPQPTPVGVQATPVDTNPAIFYNLPQATLNEATGLYASPNRTELVAQVVIPMGSTVYVMGRNPSRTHLRVVWNTGVGWIPTSFTNYNDQRALMDALPVFEREPPQCAVPITTQFNLNSKWKHDDTQPPQVAVVIDLFRSMYGPFPQSTLALTINGQPVESSRRQIVENGQFTLKDIVFKLPGYMQAGDELGYDLQTTSNESLAFVATIFGVPLACQWKID